MATEILATADNHIGFRQYGLKKREKDIENSFKKILELGVERNVSAITVSGDILHSIRPTAATVSFFKECNEYLTQNKLPCLVSIGNHDQSSPHWLRNIENSEKAGFIVLDNEAFDVDGVKVYGNTFTSREEFNLGAHLPKDVDLLLLHQPFDEFATFPNDKLFNCDDLVKIPASVAVVGDVHVHREFMCTNEDSGHQVRVLSPGSSELMSESEQSDKYVLSIKFEDGEDPSITSLPLETREILRLEIREEKDMETCIGYIKEKENAEPLVFLKFSTNVENVMSRLRTVFDPSSVIIRPRPIIEYNGVELDRNESEAEITYAEVLAGMLPTNSKLYATTSRLLDSEADVHSILEDFISERTEELKSASDS